ncbi:MAG: aminopeptidase P family protein [Pseudomonadota bacterium]
MTRLESLREVMKTQGVDLVVLAPGGHMNWLAGLKPHADERPLLMVISQSGEGILMPALESESARRQTELPFFEWSDSTGPKFVFNQLLAELNANSTRTIVLDETMRADHVAFVTEFLPDAKTSFSETTISALRIRKTTEEYAVLKQNAGMADQAMNAAWSAMKTGMTEKEVAEIVFEHFKKLGAKPMFGIIGAGPNGAMPHHHTGETILQEGDAVVMDIGAGYNGYSSDITRMAFMGEPSREFLKVHGVVKNAVEAAMEAAKPGIEARNVDAAARAVIEKEGYGEYFCHRTGHGLGSEVHEPPYIDGSSEIVLDEGMVFSIEPGIYLPGKFGIRLEDIVILRSDGPEIFSDLPLSVRIIG